eukprot:106037_1
MPSIFTGPFEDGYREFPTEPPTSVWLIVTPILIGILDIIYCYILHQTSLRMPVTTLNISSPKPNSHMLTTHQKWYKRLYAYILNADYSEYYLSEAVIDEEEIMSQWTNRISLLGFKMNFTMRKSKWLWVNVFLKVHSAGCGGLFFTFMLVLLFNLTGQFVVAVLKHKTYYNLFILFFMWSVHIFMLKRIANSVYLLAHNITDTYNMRIASIWRFTSSALTVLGALGINAQQNIENGLYASDTDVVRWVAVLMLYRAWVWAVIIAISSIVNAVYMTHKTYMEKIDFSLKITQIKDKLRKMKSHSKLNIDSEALITLEKNKSVFARKNAEKYRLKFWMLLFNLHPANSQREKILKIVYVCVIWILILVFTIVLAVIEAKEDEKDSETLQTQEYYYVCMRLLLLIYYVISLFNRGLYYSLFYFWTGQYHIEFWSILKRYGAETEPFSPEIELGDIQTIRSTETPVGSPEDSKDTELNADTNQAEDEHQQEEEEVQEQKEDKTDDIQLRMISTVDGANDSDIIVYPNVLNPQFPIKTKPILFDDFWTSIHPNKEDYFHCRSNAMICTRCIALLITFLGFMIMVMVFLSEQQTSDVSSTRLKSLDQKTEILTEYPFCDENFNGYLNMLDMSYLINTAYQVKFGYEEIAMRVEKYFKNATDQGWTLKYLQKSNPGFYHLRNTKYNFDIIAIRGTQSFEDALQDLDLFMAQYVLQWVSKVLPITSTFPYRFIRSYINIAGHITEHLFTQGNSAIRFDSPVYNYIRWNLWKNITEGMNPEVEGVPDYSLYIIGHSLGGAIADIVATHLSYEGYTHVKTVTLSSPGLLWASQYFKMDVVSYTTVSHALLNLNDPICNVDQHVGTQTWVHCDAPQISAYCHKVSPYISSVISNCGEDFENNINATMLECIKQEIYTQWKTCCFPENWECGGTLPLRNATTNIPIEVTPNYPRKV